MTILTDIRREVAKARDARARKRSLGFPESRLVIIVGNPDAYTAARVHEARDGELVDLMTFEGCEVRFGGVMGIDVRWMA